MDVKFYHNKKIKNKKIGGFVLEAKKKKVTICMFMLFLCGLIIGAVSVRLDSSVSNVIVSMFKNYNESVNENAFFKNFSNFIFINTLITLSMYLLGLCAIGSPFICFYPFIKGIGIGVVSAYIYKTYLLAGFGYCMFVLYPPQIINMMSIIMASNESYSSSKKLYSIIKSSRTEDIDLNLYNIRFIIILALSLISSLLGAILKTYLKNLFIS